MEPYCQNLVFHSCFELPALRPERKSASTRRLLPALIGFPQVGALAVRGPRDDENPHDGELTFLGRVLAHLPVNQQLGKLIVLGHVFGCLDECLIIGEQGAEPRAGRRGPSRSLRFSPCLLSAASLSLKNFFAMPFRQHLDGYRYVLTARVVRSHFILMVSDDALLSLRRSKMNFSGSSKSDCIALVEAFKVRFLCKRCASIVRPFAWHTSVSKTLLGLWGLILNCVGRRGDEGRSPVL